MSQNFNKQTKDNFPNIMGTVNRIEQFASPAGSVANSPEGDANMEYIYKHRREQLEKQVDDLAMLVRRLAHSLKLANGNMALHKQSLDYLKKEKLESSVLRKQ